MTFSGAEMFLVNESAYLTFVGSKSSFTTEKSCFRIEL